jgi:hypothetical protein
VVANGGRRLRSVAWGNDRFVAVGDSCGTMTSMDGIHWPSYTLLTVGQCNTSAFKNVAYGNNQFIASGYIYVGNQNYAFVFSSSDGLSWSGQSVDQNVPVNGMAYGNSTFVGVGGNLALVSTDGTNWSAFTVDSAIALDGIIWGGNKFVAFGMPGVYTSPDGKEWTKRDIGLVLGVRQRLISAVWNDGRYSIVCCKFGECIGPDTVKITTSSDGIAWQTSVAWTTQCWNNVRAICHGNDKYVAVGENGWITSSVDGTTWQNRSSVTTECLNDICSNGSALVAVGSHGTIISSSNGADWQLQSSGTTNGLTSIAWGNNLFVKWLEWNNLYFTGRFDMVAQTIAFTKHRGWLYGRLSGKYRMGKRAVCGDWNAKGNHLL